MLQHLRGAPRRLESWQFQDVTARDAYAVSVDDIGRLCFVVSNRSYHILRSVSPVIWDALVELNTTESVTIVNVRTETADQNATLDVLMIVTPTGPPDTSTDHPLIPIAGRIKLRVPASVTEDFSHTTMYALVTVAETLAPTTVSQLIATRGISRANGVDSVIHTAVGVWGGVEAYHDGGIVGARALYASPPNFYDQDGTYLGGTIDTSVGLYIASQESPYINRSIGIYVIGAQTENVIEGNLQVGNVLNAINDATTPLFAAFGGVPHAKPNVTGKWSDGSAAQSVLDALVSLNWVTDATTPERWTFPNAAARIAFTGYPLPTPADVGQWAKQTDDNSLWQLTDDVPITWAGGSGSGGGGGGSDAFYRHVQATPATVWSIAHDLSKYPSVTTVDSAGRPVVGTVAYTSNAALNVTFSAAIGGEAYCN